MQWTHGVTRHVLPNGLTVLVQRHAAAPVVAVVTHVRAGYFDEPDAWVGIAHVLEHMFFKGSERRGPGVLARETQRLGGYVNAGTIYDKTVYYAVGPSAGGGLEHLAELQADALRHLLLDQDELGRELEVIIQEARRKLDNPGAVTGESLYAQLFRRHRMGRWRIGTPEQLRRLTAQEVRTYYQSRYVPERVIVSLVGDLDPDAAVHLAERLWGDWTAPASLVEESPAEPPGTPGTVRIIRGDVTRPLAAFGWRTVGARHPDVAALDVGAEVLSAGRSSWLHRAVRDTGLAASVGAGHYTPGDVGVFDVFLSADSTHLAEALSGAAGAASALAESGPSDDDLRRVRALQATRWASRLEASEGRATGFAEFEALGGYAELDVYLDRIRSVDSTAIRRAAATWLSDGPGGAIYLPKGVVWDEDAWPPVPGGVAPSAPRIVLPQAATTGLTASTRDEAAGVRRRHLPSADALGRQQRGAGLVSLALVSPALREAETVATAGLTQLMVRAALRADEGHWAAAAERLGGSLGAVSSLAGAGWTLTVPPEQASAGMALLTRVAEEASFDDADVVVEARLQSDRAAARRDDTYRYPMQGVLAAAFGDHAYGLPPLGVPEQVRSFNGEDVRAWHARWCAGRTTAVAVGDAEQEALLDVIEHALGGLPDRATVKGVADPSWRPRQVDEPRDKKQSALAMAFPAVAGGDAARFALNVVASILSGLAGRLFEELRERRSLAYTVQAVPWLRRRAGAMLTYIATSPERMNEARDAMLAELQRLTLEPVDAEELDRARQYAAGLQVLGLVHVAAVRDAILDAWSLGTLGDLEQGPGALRSVSSEAVREAATMVFRPAERAEFVLAGAVAG